MREVVIISDGTGITAESLAHALLAQFPHIEFSLKVIPYIDTVTKAEQLLETLLQHEGERPLIFTSLVNQEIRRIFLHPNLFILDLFERFLGSLEQELQTQSDSTVGHAHGMVDHQRYEARIDAVNYMLATDDGVATTRYENADLILLGISRTGKTPTSLYMALQCGIRVANYPLTKEELMSQQLPQCLRQYRHRCYGLTIDSERLQSIRQERRPDSQYSSRKQCESEIVEAENLMRQSGIEFINATHYSVEEIATRILNKKGIGKRI